mmetsp:Transcript_39035/g.90850  ORF Transcript_39035/g.90850 Transcript_39035/m.90850 type:complete len:506 (-) Transcript_39035:674-2191(-)
MSRDQCIPPSPYVATDGSTSPGSPDSASISFDGLKKRDSTATTVTETTLPLSDVSFVTDSSEADRLCDLYSDESDEGFLKFRINYLIVHIAIMLADGLQGTHLYVLYEGYNFNVATLYATGFAAGALASPFMGPMVDRVGRRTSAIIYCVLEILINSLEQYECLTGLILSRVIGGITTNLLFTVFESWLVTEYRKKGFEEEKLEIILRDSVISSNISAIASGFFAHQLALYFGPVGPFEGAVFFTFVALLLVSTQWTENYGSSTDEVKTASKYMSEAFSTIVKSRNIAKIGLIQGLTEGCLMTFVFLWSPALSNFSSKLTTNPDSSFIGLDLNGEPAYGLIFGAFMACGALGGFLEPQVRSFLHRILFRPSSEIVETPQVENVSNETSLSDTPSFVNHCDTSQSDISSLGDDSKPIVEMLASICYFIQSLLISVPYFMRDSDIAFHVTLGAFLMYEFLIGVYMPCEGVIRSVYMPNDSICSLMTMLRVIVNVAVALFVYSTNFIA